MTHKIEPITHIEKVDVFICDPEIRKALAFLDKERRSMRDKINEVIAKVNEVIYKLQEKEE